MLRIDEGLRRRRKPEYMTLMIARDGIARDGIARDGIARDGTITDMFLSNDRPDVIARRKAKRVERGKEKSTVAPEAPAEDDPTDLSHEPCVGPSDEPWTMVKPRRKMNWVPLSREN
jgi:hypothetical protein